MSDAALLRDLRERVLDEDEPLAGLLRKCLALGAVTRSADLRQWATYELKGYDLGTKVPAYRDLNLPLFIDSVSGYTHVTGQQVSRFAAPAEARRYIPDLVSFRQPVEDIAAMAVDDSNRLVVESLAFAQSAWNKELPWAQDIVQIYYKVSSSALTGLLGTIRTTLLEMVLDMSQDVPLDQLPSRRQVDAAVQFHVHGARDQYNVKVGTNAGVLGVGPGSTQTQNNISDPGIQESIAAIRDALEDVEDPDERAALAQSVDDFEEAVAGGDLETVRRRGGMLNRLVAGVGNVALTTAVSEGVQAAIGAFV
ncbi:AbiTii domain-containing protein [Nocardia fluminea]